MRDSPPLSLPSPPGKLLQCWTFARNRTCCRSSSFPEGGEKRQPEQCFVKAALDSSHSDDHFSLFLPFPAFSRALAINSWYRQQCQVLPPHPCSDRQRTLPRVNAPSFSICRNGKIPLRPTLPWEHWETLLKFPLGCSCLRPSLALYFTSHWQIPWEVQEKCFNFSARSSPPKLQLHGVSSQQEALTGCTELQRLQSAPRELQIPN